MTEDKIPTEDTSHPDPEIINKLAEKNIDSGEIQYADLLVRVKAGFIDSFIIIAWILFIPPLIKDSAWRIVLIVLPILLYEPLMIALSGHTIGQWLMKIKVLNEKDLGKSPFYLTIPRTIIKYILGTISLIYIFFSDKKKAIHDNIAGTVVIYDQARMRYKITENKRDEALKEYTYPSGLQRFMFIVIWFIAYYLVLIIFLGLLVNILGIKIRDDEDLPDHISILSTVLIYGGLIGIVILAIKGLLPGAMRKKIVSENRDQDVTK